jgi:hypothetical protein
MSSETQSIEQNTKGDGKKKLVVGIVAAVAVVSISAAAGVGAYVASRPKEEPKEMRKVVTPETAEQVVEEIMAEDNSNIPESYTVTQNGTWTFIDGQSASEDAYVENDKDNETSVYFDLIVDETGKKIYSSPVLKRGAAIEKFKLDTPLDAGEYECTVEYHLIDDEQNTLTTTNVGVNVVILN